MFLKYFSTNSFDLYSSFYDGYNKIKNLSKFQKLMTYFWVLGPFIFLIERDPADLWLTLISITFLIRCFLKKIGIGLVNFGLFSPFYFGL